MVKYKNNFYGYELSIGINKENNISTFYAITNKTKKGGNVQLVDTAKVSTRTPEAKLVSNTSSTYSITQNEDKATKYSLKEFDYENKDYII